jgi:hypothetical protein
MKFAAKKTPVLTRIIIFKIYGNSRYSWQEKTNQENQTNTIYNQCHTVRLEKTKPA